MKKSTDYSKTALLIIILLSVGISAFFMTIKQGYHEDELLNYHLSNSSKQLQTDGGWNTREDFTEYLAAGEHRFDYVNVYKNQIEDGVHPPFYYMLLHTVCSFFPNIYSRYFAFFINALFMAAAIWLLYKSARRITGNGIYALIAAGAYALSIACITTTIYIRMYAALTFFVIAFIYATLRLFDKGADAAIKDYIPLVPIAALGMLTHYYFALYAGLTGIVFVVLKLKEKKVKETVKYALFSLAGVCIMLLAYPYIIINVLGEDRGMGLFGLDIDPITIVTYLIYKLITYLQIAAKELFASQLWLMAVIVAAVVGFGIYLRVVKKIKIPQKAWFIIIPGLVSFGLIALVSPFNSDRYIMASLPLMLTVGVFALIRISSLITKHGSAFSATAVIILSAAALFIVKPYYIYGTSNLYDIKTDRCIFVGTDLKEWNKNIDKLMLYDGTIIVKTPEKFDNLIGTLEDFAAKRGIITNGKISAMAESFIDSASKDKIEQNGLNKIASDEIIKQSDEVTVYISVLADSDAVIDYITSNTQLKNYELLHADSKLDDYYNWYDYFVETESYCNVYRFYADENHSGGQI